jgi:hypothetical protein
MAVRIYQPSKTAMQSGRSKTRVWVLEHEPVTARRPEPLMGWVAAGDTKNQIRLQFDSRQEAVDYAKRNGLQYVVQEPHARQMRTKAYADNFAFERKDNWTH